MLSLTIYSGILKNETFEKDTIQVTYGYPMKIDDKIYLCADDSKIEIKSETLSRTTSMEDINGSTIYENDILEVPSDIQEAFRSKYMMITFGQQIISTDTGDIYVDGFMVIVNGSYYLLAGNAKEILSKCEIVSRFGLNKQDFGF